MVPLEHVDTLVRTKKHFYKALEANGWFLPKFSSSIVTLEFLQEVRNGEVWCPKLVEIKFLPCPCPPTLDHLCELIR